MQAPRTDDNIYTIVDDVLTFVESSDGNSVRIPLINIKGFHQSDEVKLKVATALKRCYASGEGFAMLEGRHSVVLAMLSWLFRKTSYSA